MIFILRSTLVLVYTLFMIDAVIMNCPDGFTGPQCKKQNVALNQSTDQISTYAERGITFSSRLAVDGNKNTNNDINTGRTCSVTNNNNPSWWSVLLDKEYNITQMTVYLRNGNGKRYRNMQVFVNDALCKNISIKARFNGRPSPNPAYLTSCYRPQRGKNISIRVDSDYLTLCEVQIWVCSDGWFGKNCTVPCKCMDRNEICDKVTGYCRGGCARGWQGDGCQTECDNYYFGNCYQRCQCQDTMEVCNKTTGACASGCKNGTYEPDCQTVCTNKTYGYNCSQRCGRCKDGVSCNPETGVCSGGCETGFMPGKCDTACSSNTYGDNCSLPCGKCKGGVQCDTVTGVCSGGCEAGWKPGKCVEECTNRMYGENCTYPCGRCSNNSPCNKVNGSCSDGCQHGFSLPFCKECAGGFYGNFCSSVCGKCINGSACDKKYGACQAVCQTGYKSPLCGECLDERYGDDCAFVCGKCSPGRRCNRKNGTCPDGCQNGYKPPHCKECADQRFGDDCTSECGKCSSGSQCYRDNGTCPGGCEGDYRPPLCTECLDQMFGVDCTSVCGKCSPGSQCHRFNGTCPEGCQSGYKPPLCTARLIDDPPLGPAVGGVVAAVVLVIAGIVIGTILIRRSKSAKKEQQTSNVYENLASNDVKVDDDPVAPSAASSIDNLCEAGSGDLYYNNIPANIPVDSLKQHIRDKLDQGGFETEYKMIHYGLAAEHEVGKKPENKKRNRFIGLFPYDHSRVKLTPDGDSTWDYINASFVSGYNDNTTFIAAQGPNPVTVDDFWRMVWQQNVRNIVMLTRLMELNKKKCEQYWPDRGETKQCGNISIQVTFSTVRADYTIRKFKVQYMNSAARTVTQFHFTTWPDHDVPAAPALVGFWKQVKRTDEETDNKAGYPVIHCSAGVGRTGTFIALDCLVTQAETENKVNIFMCVGKMREDRMNMVQTKEQYQFVYEVLLEALESRGTFYTLSEFDQKYGADLTYTRQQEEELKKQFKSLQNLKAEHRNKLMTDALAPENIKKNRSKEILPTNRTRPFLTTPVSGCNDYINAVMLPSATRDRFYIATQTPLSNTVVDFWRLVYDHDCYTIVCLDNSQESKSLYPREKTSSTVGPFNMKTVSEDTSCDSHVHLNMTISHKDKSDSERRLDVYRLLTMDKTAGRTDTDALLEFMNVLCNNSINDHHKMLVQCLDGSRMCGVFCSMMNVVNRLRLDKEVDIFLTIRELQAIRPQFVPTYEQYKLCHDIVKEYSRSSSIYANM